MSHQNLDYVAIRRKVDKAVKNQKSVYRYIFFGMHLFFYLVTMLAIWGTVSASEQLRNVLFNNAPLTAIVVILPTALWSLMILCHMAALYIETDTAEKALREKLLMSEIGEDILRKGLLDASQNEKPKRGAFSDAAKILLSDEGELISDGEADQHKARAEQNSITGMND
jgi:hypothetical protein